MLRLVCQLLGSFLLRVRWPMTPRTTPSWPNERRPTSQDVPSSSDRQQRESDRWGDGDTLGAAIFQGHGRWSGGDDRAEMPPKPATTGAMASQRFAIRSIATSMNSLARPVYRCT